MAFSDEVIKQAWERSGGRCECTRMGHDHSFIRCPTQLTFAGRDKKGAGAWVAHHIIRMGTDGLGNCEILCWPCHSRTQNFGK